MTEHTVRILKRVFSEIERYEKKEIDEKNLMRHLEAHKGAIEESNVRNILDNFVIKIEESLYLFDEKEGQDFLINEIHKLKKLLPIKKS